MDGAWMCERCGAEAPPDAQRCRNCGAWLPAYGEDEEPRAWWPWHRIHLRTEQAPQRTMPVLRRKEPSRDGGPRPRRDAGHVPAGVLQGSGTVYGVARQVRMRTEVSGSDGEVNTTVVCDFRLEMRDREGRPVGLVPVTMRGDLFEGAVDDGDRVRATGRVKNGTLRVKKLRNLTTGAEVTARTTPAIVIAVVILLFVGWMVFIFAITGRF
ncbi:hypothetical protein [Streptomyces sp. NPDC020597]|uniref:hypothetical protein n=1 Tax=unclassified Streptomyces TaxID=2593676 RepID=UPI0037B5FD62